MRPIETVSRADWGLLAGRPLRPSPSTPYRCLQSVAGKSALECQTALGARLVTRGPVTPGPPVNVAAHNRKTAARTAMPQSCIPQEDRYGTAVRPCSPQDQASKKPRLALAASAGTTGSQVPRHVAALTRAILARDCLLVAAKEWDGGPLIQNLPAPDGVEVLTPVKSSPPRQGACDAIPLEQYDPTIWGSVATVSTTMTACDGPLRMLLKKRRPGPYCALITPACAMTADTAMPTSTNRWRRENCCAEKAFLGVHPLPSLTLHAIQTLRSLRLLAFHVVDNLRHDLGPA